MTCRVYEIERAFGPPNLVGGASKERLERGPMSTQRGGGDIDQEVARRILSGSISHGGVLMRRGKELRDISEHS